MTNQKCIFPKKLTSTLGGGSNSKLEPNHEGWERIPWGIDSRRDMRSGGGGIRGWDWGRGEILEERALCWRTRKNERGRKKKEDPWMGMEGKMPA
jgi:hypothetical protein